MKHKVYYHRTNLPILVKDYATAGSGRHYLVGTELLQERKRRVPKKRRLAFSSFAYCCIIATISAFVSITGNIGNGTVNG